MHKKINISAVAYSNSIPFVYGLLHSEIITDIELSLDVPADCADKLEQGAVDLGLIPVAGIQNINGATIVSEFCIGAVGPVRTVVLVSDVPIHEIKRIYLDYQSRTSVQLVQLLAKKYWKINPEWYVGEKDFEHKVVKNNVAALVIGDRTFAIEKKYRYTYDLSEQWYIYTGKPFVFACWVANKALPKTFTERFNRALALGLQNTGKAIALAKKNPLVTEVDLHHYLSHNLSYALDDRKMEGMKLFLDMAAHIAFARNV